LRRQSSITSLGVGRDINVFEGFSREQMIRRGTTLGVTAAVMLLAAAIFPGYALAFANRLFLGGMHYPTKTQIAHILVNHREVLAAAEHGCRPEDAKCAQGRPISFLIQVQQTKGELPEKGEPSSPPPVPRVPRRRWNSRPSRTSSVFCGSNKVKKSFARQR